MKRKFVKAPNYGRRYKKRKGIISKVTSKNMVTRPLTSVLPTTLHYYSIVTLNPGIAGASAEHLFRLGSIFDPDFTGGGHQPTGHDELSNIFERYQVYKIDWKAEFVNTDGTNPCMVGYRLNDQSTTTVQPIELIENGNAEFSVLTGAGNDSSKSVFQGTVYNCKVHGVSYKQYMSNDDYGANFGSNPVEDAYISFFADGLGTDTATVRLVLHLVYHTKLMGSKLTNFS